MTDFVSDVPLGASRGRVLVVGVFEPARFADDDLGDTAGWAAAHLEDLGFEGKLGSTAWLTLDGRAGFDSMLVVGLGDEIDANGLRKAAGSAGRACAKAAEVATTLHLLDLEGAAGAFTEGWLLGQYRYTRYLSDPGDGGTATVRLLGASEEHLEAVERGRVIAEGVAMARDLGNEASLDKPPASIAERAADLGSLHGFEVTSYDRAQIVAEGFGGLAGVGAGAAREPRMVVLDYRPPEAKHSVAFVGKGIVFDSGGLSLKTAEYMEPMKTDLCGAAAVLGAVVTIARLGVPVRVKGIMPLTENMPGGSAIRPGDVLRARNGKTIEVLNTDAEGRLVLADGLSLAAESGAELIVDVATLTGACHVALGDKIAGVFTNDEAAQARVLAAADRAGERVWPLPLPDDYWKNIESDVADMRNTGKTRYGGAINAALLLREFVGEVPWVHVDIAGPARASEAEHHVAKGATGFGVTTLLSVAESLAG